MRLEVGRIGRAHGLHGEVTVVPITNRAERFVAGAVMFAGERELRITAARPHQDRWLIRFDGIADRDSAESLRNKVLTADALGDLPEGEHWVHELIGSVVRDRAGDEIGRVSAVEANPAHDNLVLDTGKLVPIVFVVSHTDGVVVIDPPEGLLDL
jgi:16S rRNA processing protein RimM